jgi:hypothetical protein
VSEADQEHATVNDHVQADKQPGPLQEATAHDILAHLYPTSHLTAIEPLAGSNSNATFLVRAQSADGVEIVVVVRRYKIFFHYDRGEKARREYRLSMRRCIEVACKLSNVGTS